MRKANRRASKNTESTSRKRGVAPALQHQPEACYASYVDEALQLPAPEVVPMRADALVAWANVQVAVDALTPHRARIEAQLPAFDLERLFDAPRLALAVDYAGIVVQNEGRAISVDLQEKLAELQKLRAPVLLDAEVKAMMGVFPASAVDDIRRGTGPIDMGRDAIALHALYKSNAAAVGGTQQFSVEHMERLVELGTYVVTHFRRVGVRRGETTPQRTAAQQMRDRLWTLLLRVHTQMRVAGFLLFGEAAIDESVPALLSRRRGSAAKAGDETDDVDDLDDVGDDDIVDDADVEAPRADAE
jgi:hypothetical protein